MVRTSKMQHPVFDKPNRSLPKIPFFLRSDIKLAGGRAVQSTCECLWSLIIYSFRCRWRTLSRRLRTPAKNHREKLWAEASTESVRNKSERPRIGGKSVTKEHNQMEFDEARRLLNENQISLWPSFPSEVLSGFDFTVLALTRCERHVADLARIQVKTALKTLGKKIACRGISFG